MNCLNDACGYDDDDCAEINMMSAIGCDPSLIANGICNEVCNNQIGFFDGLDCA